MPYKFGDPTPVYQGNALARLMLTPTKTAGFPSRGSISTPKRTAGDIISDKAANALAPVTGSRMANKLAGLIDYSPVGALTTAFQAGQDARQSEYGSATANALATALNFIPEGKMAGAVAHSIIAPLFHGSPHKFEKFALEKIGTGEGAQAYGHGLYFAENKKVAQAYRDDLSYWTPSASVDEAANKSRWAEIANLELAKAKGVTPYGGTWTPDWERRLHSAKQEAGQFGTNPGHMYEVRVDANPEDFLQWDMPLAAHPDPVVKSYFGGNRPDPEAIRQMGDSPWYKSQADFIDNTLRATPEDMRGRLQSPEFVSDLAKRGIPGIRYLDQGSRNVGSGTHNYVVFDPSLIDITNRY
jgi:hypothetical protein